MCHKLPANIHKNLDQMFNNISQGMGLVVVGYKYVCNINFEKKKKEDILSRFPKILEI